MGDMNFLKVAKHEQNYTEIDPAEVEAQKSLSSYAGDNAFRLSGSLPTHEFPELTNSGEQVESFPESWPVASWALFESCYFADSRDNWKVMKVPYEFRV